MQQLLTSVILLNNLFFYRCGVVGAVLQTPPTLVNSLINRVTAPFPPNLQNTINPTPLKLGT